MQGMYRRMSFSTPRTQKQLKKLWNEYIHGKAADPEADGLISRLLIQFLDGVLAIPDSNQVTVVDDFTEDIVEIVSGLLTNISLCSTKDSLQSTIGDERNTCNEIVFKSLSVVELLLSCKGVKIPIKDILSQDKQLIRLVVVALQSVKSVAHYLSLLRILRCIIITDSHVEELVSLRGFEALAEIASREKQPALTSQVLSFFKVFSEHRLLCSSSIPSVHLSALTPSKPHTARMRNHSISSTGSGTHSRAGTTFNNQHQNLHSATYNASLAAAVAAAAQENEEDVSIAAKGFSIAVNVVSELLKFSPLTSAWLNLEGSALKLKDSRGPSGLHWGEEIAYLTTIPQSLLTINKESSRILHKTSYRGASSGNQSFAKRRDGDSPPYSHEFLSPDKPLTVITKHNGSNSDSSPSSNSGQTNKSPSRRKEAGGHLSQCTVSDDDSDEENDIDTPQDVLIRDQMRRQGMTALVLMSISQATCPSEVLEALSTLETMLLRNTRAQKEFLSSDGYEKIFQMLRRVEDNLVLLVPCRDVSIAAATGSQGNRSGPSLLKPQQSRVHSNSPALAIESTLDSKRSLYHSQVGSAGDFDSYYSSILMLVVNITVDEAVCTPLTHIGTKPILPRTGLVVANMGTLSLVISLLQSGHFSFIMVAIKTVFALLRSSPINVVALEESGVVSSLIELLICIVFSCSVDINAMHHNQPRDSEQDSPAVYTCRTNETTETLPTINTSSSYYLTNHQIDNHLTQIAADIVVVLQMVAVSTSMRDTSIMSVLTAIAVAASQPAADSSESGSGNPIFKCQNCEQESATLECVHDGCICDKFFRLCQECDKVFHKSAVKRSHIRLPIVNTCCSNPRAAKRLNSVDDAATDEKLSSLLKDGLSVDVCQSLLFANMNEYSRSVLCINGLTANRSAIMNCCGCDLDLSDFMIFKEQVISVVIVGVRGLLDDRKARGQFLPCEIFPSLLLCLRRLAVDPFQPWSGDDSTALTNRSVGGMKLWEAVDYRDDLLTPHSEIVNKQNQLGDQYQQPPEIHHNSPRRVRLVLLLHTIARFVVTDAIQGQLSAMVETNQLASLDPDESPIITGRNLLCCIDLLKSFGVDALLSHLLVDNNSNLSHLTIIDKQFSLWMLRECVVSANRLKPDRAVRFLEWFLWLLRSELSVGVGQKYNSKQPDSRSSNSNRLNLALSAAVKNAGSNIVTHHNSYTEYTVAALPSAHPRIPILIRLLILQELRLLMAGDDKVISKKSDLYAQVLPSACRQASIPFAATVVDSYTSRSNSLDLLDEPRSSLFSQQSAKSVPANGYNQLKTLNTYSMSYNVPGANLSVKALLTQLGYVEVLSELVMGDLCNRQIMELIDPSIKPFFGKNSSLSSTNSIVQLTDLDKEDWWGGLATLGQLLVNCDSAKECLDRYLGGQRVVTFLMPLLHYSTQNAMNSHDHAVNYASVIVGICFDTALTNGRFSAPMKPFSMSLPRFPVQQPYQFRTSGRGSASPRTHRKSFGRGDSPAFDSCTAVTGLSLLFTRPCICNIRPCTDTSHESNDVFYGLDPSQGVVGPSGLCPVYFTHERTVALIVSTVRAFPLALTSESFRSGFASGSESTTNISGLVAPTSSNHIRSRSGTYNKPHTGSFSGRPSSMVSQSSYDHLENNLPHVPTSGGITLLSRKLMMHNMSSASIHSMETDSRWETESVGRGSIHGDPGRNSFHSHQSLMSLAHALKSSVPSTHTPSVNEDGASMLGNYLKTLKPHHDEEDRFESSPRVTSIGATPRSVRDKKQNVELFDEYPFPATLKSVSEFSTPLVYFPFLKALDNELSHYASSMLILLHHALVIRSGISDDVQEETTTVENVAHSVPEELEKRGLLHSAFNKLKQMDDSTSGRNAGDSNSVVPVKLDPLVVYRQVLRKHLAILLPPAYHYPSWHTNCDAWHPPVSQLRFRSVQCGELLLALAMVSHQDVQTFILSSLSTLLDANPANAFYFIGRAYTCVSLTRLVPTLKEGLREAVGYIVSQILRYSVQVNALHELITSVSKNAAAAMTLARSASSTVEFFDAIHEEEDDETFNRNILFVLGRTAERVCPASFLHFDSTSPLESRVELPSIPSIPPGLNVSVCSWIRLGAMSGASSAPLLQLSCKHSDILIDVYFRAIHKLTPVVPLPSHRHFSGAESDESAKKTIQLCLSFGKLIRASRFNTSEVTAQSDSQIPNDPSQLGYFPSSNESHWNLAVSQLLGSEQEINSFETEAVYARTGNQSLLSSDDITDRTVRQSLSTLSSAIARYSIPDVVVEFDWSELGDWHLLNIGIINGEVTCSVDARQLPILYFSPLGYQYDASSMALKTKDSGLLVPLFDTDRSPVNAKPAPPAPISYPFFDSSVAVAKEDPLCVSLGGLLYEAKSYELVDKHVYSVTNQAFYCTSTLQSWDLEDSAQRASTLLRAFSSLISGFSGSVGEFAVLEGVVEEAQLKLCFRDGPTHGLRELKNTRLSSLSVATMSLPMHSNNTATNNNKMTDAKAPAPILQFPLMRPSSPPLMVSQPGSNANTSDSNGPDMNLNIFGSQSFPVPVVSESIAKSKSSRDKDLLPQSSVKLNAAVQIHHTNTVTDAVLALGGFKSLFPLMISDKARLIASLRVIGCMVTSSAEFYGEFKAQYIDKAILYCCKSHPHLVTLETIQVLFDLVTYANSSGSFGTVSQNTADSDCLIRTSVLELLVNLVVTSPWDSQLARSTVDWLREICDDQPDNSMILLKSVTLLPILIVLNVWSMSEMCSFTLKPRFKVEEKEKEATTSIPSRPKLRPELRNDASSSVIGSNYKPIELSRKPSAGDTSLRSGGDNVTAEDCSGTLLQVNYTEKFKVQLACSRLLKMLVCGTTGDVTQRTSLNQNHTVTGFSSSHLVSLITFAVSSTCKARLESESATSNRRGNNSTRRFDHLRYSSQFVGMPLLKQIEFASTEYWLHASAVVVLDSFLVLVNGPLEPTVINMLRLTYPGNGLWLTVLTLMGSVCVEVRQRAILLLILSFSTPDGKVDQKQIALFDRMHGFQAMAEQLSLQENGCTDSIIDAIFSLIFWSHHGKKSSDKIAVGQSNVSLSKSLSGPSALQTEGNEVQKTSSTDFGVAVPIPRGDSASGSNVFNVAELTVQIDSVASSGSPEVSGILHSHGVTSSDAKENASPRDSIRLASPRDSLSQFVGEHQGRNSPLLSSHSHKSLVNSSGDDADLVDTADPANVIRIIQTESSESIMAFEFIQVPQAIEVLVRVLQGAKSVDQVTTSFVKLENCVTLSTAYLMTTVRSKQKGGPESSTQTANQKADMESVNRNVEAIFSQKDWLVWLCDTLLIFRRRMLNSDELEAASNSVFSLSESESVGCGGGGGGDFDLSEAESEDCSSVGGDSMSEDSSSVHNMDSGRGRSSSRSQAWQQHMITQFTCPVFNFIRRLLLIDMKTKFTSTRRWNEILRLSLPETYDVQEAILLDILESLRTLTVLSEGVETTLHFLRNLGALLEQTLEKADMSLVFSMKTVQSVHSLTYKCPPDVRSRIKETPLPEVRKSFVVRCLLDHTQSLHTRVVVLTEIISSLQGYLSTTDYSKLLSDNQVVIIILGMFCEAHDEMAFHTAAAGTSGIHNSGEMEKIYFARDLLRSIISLIQTCVSSSSDCRKLIQRLLADIPFDQSRNVAMAFMNSFERGETDKQQLTSPGASNQGKGGTESVEVLPAQPPVMPTVSYSWWGSWGSVSTESQPVPTTTSSVNKQDLIVEDLETGVIDNEVVADVREEETNNGPKDVSSFILWLYMPEQSDLQRELYSRIQKEFKPVLRQVEKLRERSSQRYGRHSRALQDKRAKDKSVSQKNLREALNAAKSSEDRIILQFQKDIKAWNSSIVERVELGKAVFLGTHVTPAAELMKSPTKELRGSASRATSVRTNSFSKLVVPDNLKSFFSSTGTGDESILHEDKSAGVRKGVMSSEDALGALMTYFKSGDGADTLLEG